MVLIVVKTPNTSKLLALLNSKLSKVHYTVKGKTINIRVPSLAYAFTLSKTIKHLDNPKKLIIKFPL